jgi:folate-binding protein YgfZ
MNTSGDPIPSDERPWAPPLALLEATGPEALPFLHNLLTADLRPLVPASDTLEARPAGFLNLQGRVLFMAVVAVASPQHIWLILPEIMRAEASRLLSRYILRTKVRLASWQGTPVLQEPLMERPDMTPWHGFAQAGDQGEQYSLVWPSGWTLHWGSMASDRSLAPPHASSSWAAFHDQEIDTGIPWILPGTSGLFLPQMLDLEQLGGLSMDKGCYPGQEIVARVHFRGQVKRHLYHGSAAQWLEPGTPLYAEQATAAQRDSHASGHVLGMAPQGQAWKALLVAEAEGRYCSASGITVEAKQPIARPKIP